MAGASTSVYKLDSAVISQVIYESTWIPLTDKHEVHWPAGK